MRFYGLLGAMASGYPSLGRNMKRYEGFDALLASYKALPDVGWIYVSRDLDVDSASGILNGSYLIAETDDEEEDLERQRATFLEAPTFAAVIDNKLEHHPLSQRQALIEAVIYYLENDDFLD